MKKIRVGTWLLLQALLSMAAPVWYALTFSVRREGGLEMTRVSFHPLILLGVVLLALLAAFLLRRRRERADEYARRALEMADSVCFRLAMCSQEEERLKALHGGSLNFVKDNRKRNFANSNHGGSPSKPHGKGPRQQQHQYQQPGG